MKRLLVTMAVKSSKYGKWKIVCSRSAKHFVGLLFSGNETDGNWNSVVHLSPVCTSFCDKIESEDSFQDEKGE